MDTGEEGPGTREEEPSVIPDSEEEDDSDDVDRIPESPPVYTQDDVESRLTGGHALLSSVSEITYDDESTATSAAKVNDNMTCKKSNFDVVIDIDCADFESSQNSTSSNQADETLEIEEFPEEDDSFLVTAAAATDAEGNAPTEEPIEDLNEEFGCAGLSQDLVLDEELVVQEESNKKVVIGFRRFKPLEKIFPDVRCSEHNTVAFQVKPNYKPGDPLEPHRSGFLPKWDPKFVPMPYCKENFVFVKQPQNSKTDHGGNGSTQGQNQASRKLHVWQRIQETLLNAPIYCSQDIANVVKRYSRISEFKALNYCFEQVMGNDERTHFFSNVLPFMTSLVLHLPEIVTSPLPILRKNVNHNISLSQEQIASLLANAFFSTFPKRFNLEMDLPSINFKELFTDDTGGDERRLMIKAQKIRCLINYFSRINEKMPKGVVTYTRKNLRHSNMPNWDKLDKTLSNFVPLMGGTIEDDGAGMLMVDFANRVIGGGVLNRGAVQEEILFVIYPELILTRLFTEKLNSNEAVIITGCERFSKYRGYSVNFTYDGDFQDSTPYDNKGRRCTQIVAIDALYVSRPMFQFHPKHIARELNKAYVGFSSPTSSSVAVATGKWGCGAFNGDPQLKAIIQLLAASYAGRDIVYFTFGDKDCFNNVTAIHESIRNMKIKDIWNLLCQYHSICCSSGKATRSLTEFCSQFAAGQNWQKQQEDCQSPSSSKGNSNPRTITDFYPTVKRTVKSPTLDDANVAAITNGINQINSQTQKNITSSSGKRQREDSDGRIVTEEEIQKILNENSQAGIGLEEFKGKEPVVSDGTVTPKSPKRPKRLEDFYPPT